MECLLSLKADLIYVSFSLINISGVIVVFVSHDAIICLFVCIDGLLLRCTIVKEIRMIQWNVNDCDDQFLRFLKSIG